MELYYEKTISKYFLFTNGFLIIFRSSLKTFQGLYFRQFHIIKSAFLFS